MSVYDSPVSGWWPSPTTLKLSCPVPHDSRPAGLGSKLTGFRIYGIAYLGQQYLYKAMAWLGDELVDQSGRARVVHDKDAIKEALFDRRRNLFSELR